MSFEQWVKHEYNRTISELMQEFRDDGISKEDIDEEYEALWSSFQLYKKETMKK